MKEGLEEGETSSEYQAGIGMWDIVRGPVRYVSTKKVRRTAGGATFGDIFGCRGPHGIGGCMQGILIWRSSSQLRKPRRDAVDWEGQFLGFGSSLWSARMALDLCK